MRSTTDRQADVPYCSEPRDGQKTTPAGLRSVNTSRQFAHHMSSSALVLWGVLHHQFPIITCLDFTFTDFVFTRWTPCFECNERLLECFAWVLNSTMSIVSESNSLCSALHNIHALRSLFSVVACCRGKCLILPCILKSKTTAFLLLSHKDTPQLVMQNTNQKRKMSVV